jgi:membrane fusion protein (multidrug efflux system)
LGRIDVANKILAELTKLQSGRIYEVGIKVYFSISEQEYLHFAERINAQTQKQVPSGGPSFDLILADGSTYPHKGIGLLTNRQVDITTGSIELVCSFLNPHNILRPGQFGRLRAAAEVRHGALLVPQKAVSELQGAYQLAVVGRAEL